LAEKSVARTATAKPSLKSVNEDPFPVALSGTLLHKPANELGLHPNDENINQDIPLLEALPLSSDPPSGEATLAKKLEKIMEVLTAVAVGTNLASIGTKLGEGKTSLVNPFIKPLEKVAMVVTRTHATGFFLKILEQAIQEKDITLLFTAFGKGIQILFAGVGNFYAAGGFQVAFDPLKLALSKIIGLNKFNSFGHSASEYLKALKVVWNEMKDDPASYLKLSPKNGAIERLLVPSAACAFVGAVGVMASAKNRLMRTLFGFLRHVPGGILQDIVFAKLEDNKNMNISGRIYTAASTIDPLANLIKDPKKEEVAHQLSTTMNFIAELFFLKGIGNKHEASEPAMVA